ncbi:MAG: DUF1343 domain-containing protein [Haliscomenobacter sp.]|nr:DUF1343 domain-containing protein [Haliscomenobacter sp.]
MENSTTDSQNPKTAGLNSKSLPLNNRVETGLSRLLADPSIQARIQGNIGYLCHSASVTPGLEHGALALKRLFGPRLKALFAPQHGFATDAQDNMIESPHFYHPYLQLPVYSLYSETRVPTPQMLEHIDTLVIDLQDNGTRVYTYIWTMVLVLEACARAGVGVVILDRPNPLGGTRVEGNISEMEFRSFIGWRPLPMRHGMTIGEVARFASAHWGMDAPLDVVPMSGWQRAFGFSECGLPWVLPSPNFPTPDTAMVYPGTVLLEGTNISEGRGTTRPFELIGHPNLQAFPFCESFNQRLNKMGLKGCMLRPAAFIPTFDKFQGQVCQGLQIHIADSRACNPWELGQWLLHSLYRELGLLLEWRQPPFEYVEDILPIDLLNGSANFRAWVEKQGSRDELLGLQYAGYPEFMDRRSEVLLYG